MTTVVALRALSGPFDSVRRKSATDSAQDDGGRSPGLFVLTLLTVLLATASPVAAQTQMNLDHGWRFRAVASADHPEVLDWHTATVPGVVQTDLVKARLIADPFVGDNEKRLQWIGLTDWEYSTDFEVGAGELNHSHIELAFDGLDTFADVTLNGKPLLRADNQFRSWRVDAKPVLHAGHNTLQILLHSPTNLFTPIVAKLPILIPGTGYETLDRSKNIYPVSHYMRKAPYSYGWDWGPKFVTIGIWKPVRIEMWDSARVTGFHLKQESVTAERAVVEADLDVTSDAASDAQWEIKVSGPDGKALQTTVASDARLDRGENHLKQRIRIEHPERWYPNGYGAQSRYTIASTLLRSGKTALTSELKTGLRSVELRRTTDQWGTSFKFVINGIAIFAKGANFVPMDSFAPSITDERRRTLLTAARDVHMNMLRIWGGGFYEDDAFYDLCDELGLMVWHDFMFGGALVPGDKAFQDNVRAEAVEQVTRLSDHPSMVLWCGNNEVENAWREWPDHLEFEKMLTPEQRERIWQDYVVMFRDILKSTVAEYGNGVPYWPSTPGSNFDDVPTGKEDGDMHSWKVWSAGAPVTDYAKVHPRFLSEFGFQAMPDLETVRYFAGANEDLSSPELLNHERFIHGYDRMKQYLDAEFKSAKDFASFVYLSQVMQAEAIKFGVETMRSRRPETMGTLYWQLDDCWPVASWASIDYFGRWKALHYYAARFYASLLVTGEVKDGKLDVHIVSDELTVRRANLNVRLMRFDGTVIDETTRPVEIAALASTGVDELRLKHCDPKASFVVLSVEQDGKVLASNTIYFAKAKELALPAAAISKSIVIDGKGFIVTLSSKTLARDVALSFKTLDAKPEDSYFDLLPNETRRVHVESTRSLAEIRAALEVRSMSDATR